MADIVSAEARSQMMRRVRSKNTQPELVLRRILHSGGLRYRLHRHDLPGNPDIVLPRFRAVIFVNGCFWHGHKCHLFKWPMTNVEFWRSKITRNMRNDELAQGALRDQGWRVGIVWECSLRGRAKLELDKIQTACLEWLQSDRISLDLHGESYGPNKV